MSIRTILTISFPALLCIVSFNGNAQNVFSDSFESGDMSTTNPDGFTWDKNNRTSIVTQHPTDGPVELYQNAANYIIHSRTMPDGSPREWTAKDGGNSLRFLYRAGQNWTEQRFDLGAGYPELWFSYHIRVPLNYVRGPDSPSGGRNGKWMALLMGNMSHYSNSKVTEIIVSDWPSADNRGMGLTAQAKRGSLPVETQWTSQSSNYPNFITPSDAGRWMEVIYHMKASSGIGANNGLFRVYRKWLGERDFTLITSLEGVALDITQESINAGYNGWGGGYFLGYANDPYTEDTEWLVDNIVISTDSLLPNPPKPPTIINP